ncbi:YadA-like family protein [Caballeronia sp. LZ065]|nr:YadA-like family protein [Caballeronia sp. LZ065]MDR5780313.1 YadA-like family protein [Caballeronia sp. LZ065]
MNKAHRTVWSDVIGNWVAVPETAKGKTKRSQKAISAAVSSLAMALGGGSMPAEAAGGTAGLEICENGTDSGINSNACALPSSGGVQNGWGLFTNNGAGFTTSEPAFITGVKQGYVTMYGQNGVYSWSDLYMNGANNVLGGTGTAHKIKGLAAGDVSTSSQDAVNGSQLYATNQSINSIVATGTKYFHANSTGADSVAMGADSIAIGQATTAAGREDIALGANATASGTNPFPATAIGKNAQALSTSAMAFGTSSFADKNTAIAMGYSATASDQNTTAIGAYSLAQGYNSSAIGREATAAALRSTALGYRTNAVNPDDVALGSRSTTAAAVNTTGATIGGKDYTFAGSNAGSTVSVGSVGSERTVTNVAAGRLSSSSTDAVNGSQLYATNQAVDQNTADISNTVNSINSIVATGTKYFHANSTGDDSTATGLDSVAIGQGAVAANANDIALGSNSTTAGVVNTIGATIGGKDYAFAGSHAQSTLSVGSVGAERTVTNVAAGRLSATSTDAMNGSQLYATNQAVDQNTADISNTVNSINSIVATGTKYFHANSTGDDSTATGVDAIAIGQGAAATHANSIALGSNSITSEAVATAGIAINGMNYAFAGSAPVGTLSVGSTGAERTITNVAAGRISAASTDAVNGSQLHATNQAVSSLQTEVSTISTDINALNNASVKYDTHADGTPDTSSITLSGGAYDSSTRTGGTAIRNVAYGVDGGDAVNVSQLNEVIGTVTNVANAANNPFMAAEGNRDTEGATATGTHSTAMGALASASGARSTAVGSGASASAANSVALGARSVADRDNSVSVGAAGAERQITNVAAGAQGTDAVNLSQMNQSLSQGLNQANAYTDQKITALGSQVSSVARGAYAGVAAATALSMIPDVDPGKTLAVGVGTANYKGYQATALGASARVTANVKLRLGAGVSAAGTAVGGGASYQW